jgi:hypothetical protein
MTKDVSKRRNVMPNNTTTDTDNGEFRFKAEDFGTPARWFALTGEPGIHPKAAADIANALLSEHLKKCPRVYAKKRNDESVGTWTKQTGVDTHEAVLMNVREIEK